MMQSAEARFHAIVVGLLVPFIVLGVVKLAPLFSGWSRSVVAAGTIGAALASAGVYRLLTLGLDWLLRRSELLKRLILGSAYLHGTWVGWFIGHGKELRYVVEIFEQNLTSVTTRGMSFTVTGEKHGEWESEATLVDATKGRFLYTCAGDFIAFETPTRSVASFRFERRRATDPPHALDGQVADVHDGVKLDIREVKATNKQLGFREALPIARQKHAQATDQAS